jgi:hypothetical protein
MIASVHIADVGARRGLRIARRPLRGVAGLREAQLAFAAPLRASVLPAPDFGRVALLAFWDGDAALDAFLAEHPLAASLDGGWRVRLAPLRAHGSWPGLPDDLPTTRVTEHTGRAAVLTLGRLRIAQAVRFLRTSAKAEGAARGAGGLIWATGLGRPPFVATCSLWESTRALSTYAFGQRDPAHADAIAADRAKPFHHASAFVRFRPYASHGALGSTNPLPAHWLAT